MRLRTGGRGRSSLFQEGVTVDAVTPWARGYVGPECWDNLSFSYGQIFDNLSFSYGQFHTTLAP